MKQFVGTKIINAIAMTRLAYNDLRGWELPADENGDDEGYLVEYLDGGQANHPDYAGYISWSPKAVFEKAYVEIGDADGSPDHILRVKAERAQLHDRLTKLQAFFDNARFQSLDAAEKSRMQRQAMYMIDYQDVLDSRLNAVVNQPKQVVKPEPVSQPEPEQGAQTEPTDEPEQEPEA